MPHTEFLGELAGLAALEALDGPEQEAFESHLREKCGACQATLAEWRGDLSLVAFSAPEVAPPAFLRARLLQLAGSA